MYGLCKGEEPLRGKLYRYSLRTRTLRARSQVHRGTRSQLPNGRSQFAIAPPEPHGVLAHYEHPLGHATALVSIALPAPL